MVNTFQWPSTRMAKTGMGTSQLSGDAARVGHLGGTAGGVDQADRVATDIGRIQGADEQLVVGAVDRVAALERQHVAPLR